MQHVDVVSKTRKTLVTARVPQRRKQRQLRRQLLRRSDLIPFNFGTGTDRAGGNPRSVLFPGQVETMSNLTTWFDVYGGDD